jgi:choline-sulfatase
VDVVQTVAGLGGADAPEDWDGDSMLPLLDDPKHGWKDFAVSQYYGHNIASGYAMIRSGQWKYVYHTPPRDDMQPERELYDIAADTGEFRNLAADPSQRDRIADLESRLVLELGEHPDETEQRSRAELAIGYLRLSQPLGQ